MADSKRLKLQVLLEEISGLDKDHVKFQPPPNFRTTYPAIRYKLVEADKRNADNRTWFVARRYQITLVHPDPDNDIVGRILWGIPGSKLVRTYTANNLNHYVFNL